MDSKSPLSQLFNRRGITILYVIAALILAVAIGSALMKMVSGEIGTSGDYSSMNSALFAARSGIQASESYLSDDNTSTNAMAALDNFYALNNAKPNITPVDFLGSSTSPLSFGTNGQSYYVSIIGWDNSSKTIELRSLGKGKDGSQKEIKAFYVLNVTTPQPGTGAQHALYIGKGGQSTYKVQCPQSINGATYIGSSTDFDGWSSGSLFDGTFQTAQNASGLVKFQGIYTFNAATYFGMTPQFQNFKSNDPGSRFNGPVGFEYGASTPNGCDYILSIAGGKLWSNALINAGLWANITVNGIPNPGNPIGVYPNGGNTTYNGITQTGTGPTSPLRVLLGLSAVDAEPAEVIVDPGVLNSIPSTQITTLSSYTSVSGTWLNTLFNSKNQNELWNGFLVIQVTDKTSYLADDASKTNFTGKVIWWIKSGGELDGSGGSQGLYNESTDARSLFFIDNGGVMDYVFGWTGKFYGYVNSAAGGTFKIDNGTGVNNTGEWVGAIHIEDGAKDFQLSMNGSSSSKITFNPSVINSFPAGLVHLPTGTPQNGAPTANGPIKPIIQSILY